MKFVSINALYFTKREPLKVVNIDLCLRFRFKGVGVDFLGLYFTVIGSVLLQSLLCVVFLNSILTTDELGSSLPPCKFPN